MAEKGNEVTLDEVARRAGVGNATTKRPLALAATEGTTGRRAPLFDGWHAAITDAAEALVRRARPQLHPDLTVTDLLALVSGAALAADTQRARRLVALLRTGITGKIDGESGGAA